MKRVTIGFSIHRSEVISITAELMHRHDIICLEEPPADGLKEMLQGELSIDDYLWFAEVEYPEFSRLMCRLLREKGTGYKGIRLHLTKTHEESDSRTWM